MDEKMRTVKDGSLACMILI